MKDLFTCEDPAVWTQVYDKYWDVVQATAKKPEKLLSLDKWYQEELPSAIAGRREKLVTRAELVKLMEWKLTRGRFRPRLQQLVASNGEESVEKCSREAFSLLPDVRAAVAELSSLKGVGAATASAVLAAGAPELVAFMSDEAVESVPGLKPIKYTAEHYQLYLNKMIQLSKTLNTAAAGQDWTPHRLELCLWAWTAAARNQYPLLDQPDQPDHHQTPTKKRRTK